VTPVRALLAGLWLLLALALPAVAEERILNFDSDVTVNTDASLTVRETITFMVEGVEINHGIKRDFPTTYTDARGQRVRVGFDVLEVKRDGRPEPYEVLGLGNGKEIKIGSGDIWLERGEHTYEISYRTTRQLGFFDDFDELYWNVTGNGWTFAIDKAKVTIRLPPGARIGQHAEYTGPQGSTASNATVLAATGNEYRAVTSLRLERYQGFTVAVAWQKGIVTPPSETEKLGWWLSDNAGIFGLIATLLAAGVYYFYSWNRVGRDPPKGTIIPLFRPPDGLGPSGVRYVMNQGFDDRTFAAGVVGLAVSGRLKIVDDDDQFSLSKLQGPGAPVAAAEQALYQALPSGTTVLKQSNHVAVRAVRSAMEKALAGTYDGTAFLRNLSWFWKGAAISVAGLIGSALLLPSEEGLLGLFGVAWTSVWWGAILAVGWGLIKGLFTARGIFRKIGSIIPLLFLIPFLGAGVGGPVLMLFGAGSPGLYMLLGGGALLAIMNIAFFNLLRAPTVEGRKLLDQIEGFKMYMTTAEENRLNVLHPPEKTPELFEKYLPYALALDCENEWNAKFATVLGAAAAAGATAPSWYSGSHWDAGRTGSFTDSLGSSLSSSISSASTAPGSSSGSGGGGSSGGGGGGGGGSGW